MCFEPEFGIINSHPNNFKDPEVFIDPLYVIDTLCRCFASLRTKDRSFSKDETWNLDSIFLPPFKSWSFVLLSSYSWNTTQFNLNFLAWASFAFLLGTFSLAWADKQSHFFFNTELRASRWPEFFVELLFSMTSLSVWLVAANRVSHSVGDNDKIHFLIRYLAGTYERLENSSTFSFYLFT